MSSSGEEEITTALKVKGQCWWALIICKAFAELITSFPAQLYLVPRGRGPGIVTLLFSGGEVLQEPAGLRRPLVSLDLGALNFR